MFDEVGRVGVITRFDELFERHDPSKTRDMRRVSEAFHRPEGILYLYGYRVKPQAVAA